MSCAICFIQVKHLLYKQHFIKQHRIISKNYVSNLFHQFKSELTANPFKILKPQWNIRFLDLVILFPRCKSTVTSINL